jgi:hypothetical protein
MSRRWWIVIGVGVGVVLAILIGVLGTRNEPSKADATSSLCSSLKSLESSVKSLTSLDPSTASKTQYQSDVSAIEDDWNQVKTDAGRPERFQRRARQRVGQLRFGGQERP